MVAIHFPFLICHPYSHLPLGEGLGVRVQSIEKENRYALFYLNPHPTLSQRERELKWKMSYCPKRWRYSLDTRNALTISALTKLPLN